MSVLTKSRPPAAATPRALPSTFAVQSGSYAASTRYAADYQAYLGHSLRWNDFLARYPVLETALNLMAASDGAYEYRADLRVPDSYGRETGLRAAPGSTFYSSDCRSGNPRAVTANNYTWFDFDCDYCTGPWSHQTGQGYFHHTWSPSSWAVSSVAAAAPPEAGATVAPNPGTGGTRIRLAIPEAGTVEVSILDVAGRRVRQIAGGRFAAGGVEARWDGRNDAGDSMPAGVYLYRVRAGAREFSGRFVMIQ